jgi:hypothetical protein
LWQDRLPRFFDLYSHFSKAEPLVFAYRDLAQGKTSTVNDCSPNLGGDSLSDVGLDRVNLAACSVILPLSDGHFKLSNDRIVNLNYDTDFYISANLRLRGLSSKFIADRGRYLTDQFKVQDSQLPIQLFFGIENQSGFLNEISKNRVDFSIYFVYGPESTLHEIYVDDHQVGLVWSPSNYTIKKCLLSNIESSVLNQLMAMDNFDGEKELVSLFPNHLTRALKNISRIDPAAELWAIFSNEGRLLAGLTLASLSKIRKFRFNKNAIALNHKDHPLLNLGLEHYQELRSLIVGQTWLSGLDKEPLMRLLREVQLKCLQEKYHNFYVRDCGENSIKKTFSQSFHYTRKLFFWVLNSDLRGHDLITKIGAGHYRFKVDNHFL